jgi:hypothetical protein
LNEARVGVGEDFSKFKDNYNIASDLIGSISYRYKRITRQLNTDFRNTTSDTANSLYVGSYGRDTAAKGVSDLDIAYVLPYSEYVKYSAYTSNGPSALLQAVRQSIRNTYPTSDSFGDGQVVVISFNDNIKFEVLPVFENKDGQSWTYPNAEASETTPGPGRSGSGASIPAFSLSDRADGFGGAIGSDRLSPMIPASGLLCNPAVSPLFPAVPLASPCSLL